MIAIIDNKSRPIRIFSNMVEENAFSQINDLIKNPNYEDCNKAFMSDVHAGKNCTIGTVIDLHNAVNPSMVGVDIGCGMLTIKLKEKEIDFKKLDRIINSKIPSGLHARGVKLNYTDNLDLTKLHCYDKLNNTIRLEKSIGTLGGGNHFIEIDIDKDGFYYLIIHTGSRNLGKQVCNIYEELAVTDTRTKHDIELKQTISGLRFNGDEDKIKSVTKKIKKQYYDYPPMLTYNFQNYIDDMKIVQYYASINRKCIAKVILDNMELTALKDFETIHNYIDCRNNILRKGAIAAYDDEYCLIPLNMRDGSLLCKGMGNRLWLYSAPHGAGRIMSRKEAKKTLDLESYRESMKGIYTTSVCPNTIDEAPMAYKPAEEIIENIKSTVVIVDKLKPVYNFKNKD